MSDWAAELARPTSSRILLVVLDGLGGLPLNGRTELEQARTPNLDSLAKNSSLGVLVPVEHGIIPGSGQAHIALFGYDPFRYQVGRGVLECLGVGLNPGPGDLCCRANFCNFDGQVVTSRRAVDQKGERMSTELCRELCDRLQAAFDCGIEDVRVIVRSGEEHRFAVMFAGSGLADGATDSDPGSEGLRPRQVEGKGGAEKTARVANEFIRRCAEVLVDRQQANYVLLRGLGLRPQWPTLEERFRLRAACVAAYPMYRGLAELVGMNVVRDVRGDWPSQVDVVEAIRTSYDFVFFHLKDTDRAGEDGRFERKVELIETFDAEVLPRLRECGFDVLCLTGDHSTPAVMKKHSWHPIPVLLWSRYAMPEGDGAGFTERICLRGNLGVIYSRQLMGLLLAHAGKLNKFGA